MAAVRRGEIPRHLSCIMDGNGRWAAMRDLSRSQGHAAAEESIDATVDACLELGISWLSVYAFSTENWTRDPAEVQFLMSMHEWLLRDEKRRRFRDIGVRLRFIGELDDPRIPNDCRKWLADCEEMTRGNDKLQFVIAFNYGGRAEMLHAVKALAAENRDPDQLTEDDLARLMYAPEMPSIDLLIRTSSEFRLSNYLPWHLAYAEFVFVDTLWPDFRGGHVYSAVAEFQSRRRRMGGDPVTGGID